MRDKRGFTLVELLVVISIIALLLTLLVPALGRIGEKARQVKCKGNLRLIGQAMIAFADDHNGRLPGSYDIAAYELDGIQELWMRPYVGCELCTADFPAAPWLRDPNQGGTILEYLPVDTNTAYKIYTCPSQRKTRNKMSDYCMVKSLCGGKLNRIPVVAMLYRIGNPQSEGTGMPEMPVSTPLVVEEAPDQLNGNNFYPGFENKDRLGMWHGDGNGFYIGVDGGVVDVKGTHGMGPWAWEWEVKVGENWYNIADPSIPFGKLPW